jgi:hypothetical protein
MCILCDRRRVVLRDVLREAAVLTAEEKTRLVSSLQERLRDVLEVVPAGQPATRMRHDATLHAAPGVTVAAPSTVTNSPTRKET